MASIDTGGGGGGKKGQPKRINTRVDFTPMVDMNMLLLTFFMFCTTLSKPQVLPLAMPVPDDKIVEKNEPADTKASKALTIILAGGNKVYYYKGVPDYNDYTTLKETTYPSDKDNGIRQVLIDGNGPIIEKMRELRKSKDKHMTNEAFDEAAKEIKKDPDGQVVVIKPLPESTYENLVDALDEMAICSIGRYAVVDPGDAEDFLLENYFSKGKYGQEVTAPKDKSQKKK